MLNDKKIAFIICTNDDLMLNETLNYLDFLIVPNGYEVDILTIGEARSMLEGMQEGREATDAKYKVYLHQDTFILYPLFIESLLEIFESDSQIGMIGMVGASEMPDDGVMWHGKRVGALYNKSYADADYKGYQYKLKDGLDEVKAVDGFLFATAYDVPLRSDLFDGWDFYDVSTSFEYIRNGYKVVVPVQHTPWCLHDDGTILSMWNYDKYRHIMLTEYKEFFGAQFSNETLKVLICTENTLKFLQLNVEFIRSMASELTVEIYVADNGSTDGTRKWLETREDLSYVCFDEGRVGYARMLNESLHAFGIEENVLILQSRYFMQPECAEKLLGFISRLDFCDGIIGFFSNGFHNDQYVELNKYGESGETEVATYANKQDYFRELGVHVGAFYLHGKIYRDVGPFCEDLKTDVECMEDYCLRCIQKEKPIVIPTEVIAFYDVMEGADREETEEKIHSRDVLRKKWEMNYFNMAGNMHLVIQIIKESERPIRVLEIGCDNAATLLAIKNRLPMAEIYGAEINKQAANIASHFAKVECGDINKEFPFADVSFDYIIFGDVLEHLPDPKRTLEICKEHLSKEGCIIASIPNVMHISVIRDLLRGNFTYTDIGLLDKTHIHLFTFNEIVKMFQSLGFNKINIGDVILPIFDEDKLFIEKLLQLEPSAESFMYEAFQYIVKAQM